MADTKITALTALTGADPANDVIPIVDVSDTTMAASGTTKKISVNNILGASGTATLASATITGDLTVATSALKVVSASNRVLINQASAIQGDSLEVSAKSNAGAISLFGRASDNMSMVAFRANGATTQKASIQGSDAGFQFITGSTTRYTIDSTGIATWSDVGGVAGTAMTLNSTGLGVGGSPTTKLDVRGANNANQATFSGTAGRGLLISTRSDSLADDRTVILNAQFATGSLGQLVIQTAGTDRLLVDASGNVGIGVTPSAWGSNWKANQVGPVGSFASSGAGSAPPTAMVIGAYNDNTNWKYQFSSTGAARYEMTGSNAGSVHAWYTSPGGTVDNNITDFATPKMTLDADGNLLVGTTSGTFRGTFVVAGGADRDILAAGVTAVSDGFQVKWNHATTTLRVILANIPTSSAGLAAGTLWNDAGTIKIA